MANESLDYLGYLRVDDLTSCQHLESAKHGDPAHIEMMYIIVHQTYELWFKQILHELNSVISMFEGNFVNEKNIGIAVDRLRRVVSVQRVLIEQINVLETMTPLEFLDFRKYLGTASGFQSFQFRMIENRLGMKREQRLKYMHDKEYLDEFSAEKQAQLQESEAAPSLLHVVGSWLERTPFLQLEGFSFVDSYQQAVGRMLDFERRSIENAAHLDDPMREQMLLMIDGTAETTRMFLDEAEHERLYSAGQRSFSYKATLAALFINLYRDEPILHLAFKLLETLVDIDEEFTDWRNRHAVMVHRMLGRKMGTGESSGYEYLKRTAERYRIFVDLFNLSTFLIPRSELPELPENLKRNLGFYYSAQAE